MTTPDGERMSSVIGILIKVEEYLVTGKEAEVLMIWAIIGNLFIFKNIIV